ncbi:MAG: hypothetical protein LBU42_00785 [Prevotellaceae bacterium]|jgi:hypothetical protein|nr:hypothetical protein [Prevotellaceae bacterium]
MRREGNNILITLDEWQAAGLSYNMYDNDRKRGYLQTANRGCNGRVVEIIWQSIVKECRKQAIIARHGKPEDICSVLQFADSIMPDVAAQNFYNSYLLPDGRHLPTERIAEYTANVEVLNAIERAFKNRCGTRSSLGGGRRNILASLTDSANKLDRRVFPHSLPTAERRMRDVIKRYHAEGYMAFVHKNFTNKHAAKVDTEVKESVMTELLSDPRNLDNEQIRAFYNAFADKLSWKPITASAVAVWRNKLYLTSYAGRRGETALRNRYAMQAKRSAPTAPLYFWTADGWDVELLYQKTDTDKNGHSVTTYHNRLTVVVVLDPCEKYPVGYAIGDHETPELIRDAFRNAANHTAELFGQRHRAHQLQTDHYAAKALAPLYSLMAGVHTPARVRNAKAKIVEPYFLYLNKTRCQIMPNWSGFGVTSQKDSQPNVEHLNKSRHMFPDREGLVKQITIIMEAERAIKREKYLARWNSMPEADRLLLRGEDYLYFFGASTGKKNLLQSSGIQPTIDGIRRDYECFDIRFREHYGVQWTVRYDPDNLSEALAINDDGTLRFLLREKYVQPMALRERKDGDAEALTEVTRFNRMLEASITERRAAAGEAVRQLVEENPQLNNTLTKLLLVDSRGQHKDARNAVRRRKQVEEVTAEDLEAVPVVITRTGEEVEEEESIYNMM